MPTSMARYPTAPVDTSTRWRSSAARRAWNSTRSSASFWRAATHIRNCVGSRDDRFCRGSKAGLCTPLPTLRRRPCGRLRTARGRCGSLLLHRKGLVPSTPCRPLGALRSPSHKRERRPRRWSASCPAAVYPSYRTCAGPTGSGPCANSGLGPLGPGPRFSQITCAGIERPHAAVAPATCPGIDAGSTSRRWWMLCL